MANVRLERDVADELLWDPRVDAEAIAVSAADDGTVTLRGTVGTFRESDGVVTPGSADSLDDGAALRGGSRRGRRAEHGRPEDVTDP